MIQKHVRGWLVYKKFKHLLGDKRKRWMRKLLDLFKWVVIAALVLLLLALASRFARPAIPPRLHCGKAQSHGNYPVQRAVYLLFTNKCRLPA